MPPKMGPEYHVTARFRAPLEFVFRWCTDYTPGDAVLEGETYERRILSRNERQVVFEDVESMDDGWAWKRYTVDLRPPRHWHAVSVGNRRNLTIDYELTEDGPDRTRLDLWWRRRPGVLAVRPPPPKAAVERESTQAWRRFAAALEGDYRNAVRPSGRRSR
jgi:hypothetical protein